MEYKKGVITLNFKEIEELNSQDTIAIYEDIIEFGGDVHLADHIDECCAIDGSDTVCTYYRYMLNSECVYWSLNWCRSRGRNSSSFLHYNYAHFYECI